MANERGGPNMDEQRHLGIRDEDELPEHETRPEGREGGGMTNAGISAEQYGPVDEAVVEAQEDEEPRLEPDKPPPAYRPRSG
jgi:hypothetical protein